MHYHLKSKIIKSSVKLDLSSAAHAALGSAMIRSYCSMMALYIVPVTVFAIVVMPYLYDLDSISNGYLILTASTALGSSLLFAFFMLCAWVSARLPLIFSRVLFFLAAIGAGVLTFKQLQGIFVYNGVSPITDMLEVPWQILLVLIFSEITILAILVAISPLNRLQVIRDLPWKAKRLFDHLVGAPPALSQMAKRRTGVRSRYLFGTLILAFTVGSLIQVQNLTLTDEQHEQILKICSRGDPAQYLQCQHDAEEANLREGSSVAGMALLAPLVLVFGILFARKMINGAKKRALKYAADASTDKSRPNILFLRAFDDDQVNLPARHWTPARWLFSLRRINAPLDHLLVEDFSDYGRITALGKGNEHYPPFGAVREYCHLADWKETVIDRARQAAAIIMCVADDDLDREGIKAELDILMDEDLRAKTLFVVRPRAANKGANRVAWSMTGLQPPDSLGQYLCSFVDLNGERHWGQARAFNQMEYLVALKWFFYSRFR